jgi:cytidyltransferase-like protein
LDPPALFFEFFRMTRPDGKLTWVYVDCVCDLFHAGHIAFFEKARALGDRLVVGLHSDEVVATYKPKPILSFDERLTMVANCRLVDRVVPEPVPLHCTPEHLDAIGADFACHGDDMDASQLQYWYGALLESGRFRSVSYTSGISSREIIARVVRRYREGTLRDQP